MKNSFIYFISSLEQFGKKASTVWYRCGFSLDRRVKVLHF